METAWQVLAMPLPGIDTSWACPAVPWPRVLIWGSDCPLWVLGKAGAGGRQPGRPLCGLGVATLPRPPGRKLCVYGKCRPGGVGPLATQA